MGRGQAERKRLSGPLRCYQNRLVDEEARLFKHQVQRPERVRLARWVYRLEQLVTPQPRRRRGSAARYKSRR